MLQLSRFEDLVAGRLHESDALQVLASYQPENVDLETVGRLVANLLSSCSELVGGESSNLFKSDATSECLDNAGTGGSGRPLRFNVSTAAAIVAAAGGVQVAKFGNRSMTGSNGSFDFLEQIGLGGALSIPAHLEMLESIGITFLFAPQIYPGLKHLSPLRKKLGKPTIFNLIGPLLNPIRPAYRVMGVSASVALNPIAAFLAADPLVKGAAVIRSHSGLDELVPDEVNRLLLVESLTEIVSATGATNAFDAPDVTDTVDTRNGFSETVDKRVSEYQVGPFSTAQTVEQSNCPNSDSVGPEALVSQRTSAEAFGELLELPGQQSTYRNLVCYNAALALMVARKCCTIEAGYELADGLLNSGEVKNLFEKMKVFYAKHSV